ncbi:MULTISPECIES: head-tail adaptor protein [Paracoccus]|uniref:head-tail adaptor protein n=1 Tax=Paracoccus TaxID=265 RepID=UPI001FB5FECE|nr:MULTISPECIES: head-tail adaptor protein [Paracoccus]MCJ1900954.1 head-tail adaptor protein [Paracoccus versutus]MDF3906147.1 head-tail adaptor protein [Paracoccus sp. AS002]
MQAGKLQHRIELQRMDQNETRSPSWKPQQAWVTYATGKAEMRQAGISEFLTSYGESSKNTAVFIIRWIPGVAVSDRLIHGGKAWNVVAIAEIGRRKGLEIRAVAA